MEYHQLYERYFLNAICFRIINDYQFEEQDYYTVKNKKMQLMRLDKPENAIFS